MAGTNQEMRIRAAELADAEVIAAFKAAMALERERKRLDMTPAQSTKSLRDLMKKVPTNKQIFDSVSV